MAKHVLSLEVLDTLNEGILRIIDTSVYATNLPIDCPTLEVTVPGFNYPSVQTMTPNFTVIETACLLELQIEDCGTLQRKLPDGIYIIKYSVSPKDIIYVEYNYLRVSTLMNRYKQILCELDINDYAPDKEKQDKLDMLNQIRMYIEAAKAKVEICHEPKKGMALYAYAKKLLSNFDCRNCQ